ncbi:MAG: hypothetical protein ABIA63_10240, partial [bacterium]
MITISFEKLARETISVFDKMNLIAEMGYKNYPLLNMKSDEYDNFKNAAIRFYGFIYTISLHTAMPDTRPHWESLFVLNGGEAVFILQEQYGTLGIARNTAKEQGIFESFRLLKEKALHNAKTRKFITIFERHRGNIDVLFYHRAILKDIYNTFTELIPNHFKNDLNSELSYKLMPRP